jgi:predicted nucleic acid-binding protein
MRSSTAGRAPEPGAPRRVFLDTGIFVAFLDKSDGYHRASARLFADPPRRWWTSAFVVAETYGWFLHRLGEEAARTFRLALGELPRLELLMPGAAHLEAVTAVLERHRGRKLTYVDASSLAFLRHLRIGEVWGTDRDLSIEGARVVPILR